ncbi:hypothetical protein DFH09DRAFT_1067187 [Mycena vulgaris]|nr:hypothetical protein DFH09DRAFT_1067187 [Mycena vulgaris]
MVVNGKCDVGNSYETAVQEFKYYQHRNWQQRPVNRMHMSMLLLLPISFPIADPNLISHIRLHKTFSASLAGGSVALNSLQLQDFQDLDDAEDSLGGANYVLKKALLRSSGRRNNNGNIGIPFQQLHSEGEVELELGSDPAELVPQAKESGSCGCFVASEKNEDGGSQKNVKGGRERDGWKHKRQTSALLKRLVKTSAPVRRHIYWPYPSSAKGLAVAMNRAKITSAKINATEGILWTGTAYQRLSKEQGGRTAQIWAVASNVGTTGFARLSGTRSPMNWARGFSHTSYVLGSERWDDGVCTSDRRCGDWATQNWWRSARLSSGALTSAFSGICVALARFNILRDSKFSRQGMAGSVHRDLILTHLGWPYVNEGAEQECTSLAIRGKWQPRQFQKLSSKSRTRGASEAAPGLSDKLAASLSKQ